MYIGANLIQLVVVFVPSVNRTAGPGNRPPEVDAVEQIVSCGYLRTMLQLSRQHARVVHDRLSRAQLVGVPRIAGVVDHVGEEPSVPHLGLEILGAPITHLRPTDAGQVDGVHRLGQPPRQHHGCVVAGTPVEPGLSHGALDTEIPVAHQERVRIGAFLDGKVAVSRFDGVDKLPVVSAEVFAGNLEAQPVTQHPGVAQRALE